MKELLIALLLLTPLFAQKNIVYAGYVPTYRTSNLAKYDYDNLTHVFAAFGNPDSSGTITIAMDIDNFSTVVKANGKTKAYISIGGGGDYGWDRDTCETYRHLFADTNRTAFIDTLIAYVQTHNLDGVDSDIEGYALEYPDYPKFANELADSLHANNLELTGAVGAAFGSVDHVPDSVLQKFDLIMTMSYGGTWNTNNYATFDAFVSDMDYLVGRGVDSSKIAGGIPFYAVAYNPKRSLTLSQVYANALYNVQDPFYNDTLIDTATTANNGYIYLNGWPTIKEKIDFVDSTAYAGIMIWEIGQDNYSGAGYSMTDTIANYINPPTPVASSTLKTSKLKFNMNEVQAIRVVDVRGRLIARFDGVITGMQSHLENTLPQGVYFTQYIGAKGVLHVDKFITR